MERYISVKQNRKILNKIKGVIKKGKEAEWLNTPNEKLGNLTPLQKMSEGPKEIKEVLDVLIKIEWGIPS